MKAYSATVRDIEGGRIFLLEGKCYNSLKEFRSEIKANGCRVYKDRIAETSRFNWILENTNGDAFEWRQKTGTFTIGRDITERPTIFGDLALCDCGL
jgi:hypothetical protein